MGPHSRLLTQRASIASYVARCIQFSPLAIRFDFSKLPSALPSPPNRSVLVMMIAPLLFPFANLFGSLPCLSPALRSFDRFSNKFTRVERQPTEMATRRRSLRSESISAGMAGAMLPSDTAITLSNLIASADSLPTRKRQMSGSRISRNGSSTMNVLSLASVSPSPRLPVPPSPPPPARWPHVTPRTQPA